jgi:predicted RND superfamily exporter protein
MKIDERSPAKVEPEASPRLTPCPSPRVKFSPNPSPICSPRNEEEEEAEQHHSEAMAEYKRQQSLKSVALGSSLGASVLKRYARLIIRFPKLVISFYAFLVILAVVLFWRPVDLQTDFASFVKADGDALRNNEAFLQAVMKQKTPSGRRLFALAAKRRGSRVVLNSSFYSRKPRRKRRLQEYTWQYVKDLTFIYKAHSGNVLSDRVLKEIRDFEMSLRSLPKWNVICKDRMIMPAEIWRCDPGETFMAMAWPYSNWTTHPNELRKLKFNGLGQDLLPMPVTFKYMHNTYKFTAHPSRDVTRYFPTGFDWSAYTTGLGGPPSALRSVFTFTVGYGKAGMSPSEAKADKKLIDDDMKNFFTGPVYDIIQNFPGKFSKMYYHGSYIDDYEVMETLFRDIMWSVGSVLFTTLYMWIHMRSVLISFACFCIVFGSVILAYVATPSERTTLATFSSVFLITVIDIDVIFVFVGFWGQSKYLGDMEKRVSWTMFHAGKSCMATSVTTSVSFFANLASVLQPLREFGMLMGLCVMSVYVLALAVLPPLMAMEERWKEGKRRHFCAEAPDDELSVLPVGITADSGMAALADKSERDCEAMCRQITPDSTYDRSTGDQSPKSRPSIKTQTTTMTEKTSDKSSKKKNFSGKMLFGLVEAVSKCKCFIVVLTVLVVPLFLVGIVLKVEMDTGEPKIFPEEHNQIAGKELEKIFDKLPASEERPPPSATGTVCKGQAFAQTACMLAWCESELKHPDPGTLSCYQKPTRLQNGSIEYSGFETDICHRADIRMRLSSKYPIDPKIVYTTLGMLINTLIGYSVDTEKVGMNGLPPLVFEQWATGKVEVAEFYQTSNVPAILGGSLLCEVEVMCSYNSPSCDLPGWNKLDPLVLPTTTITTAAPARRLLATSPPDSLYSRPPIPIRWLQAQQDVEIVYPVTTIHVLFGLRVPISTPRVGAPEWRWQFDPTFEPWNPWGQRAIRDLCDSFPEELIVTSYICWVKDFKYWITRDLRTDRFPTRNFNKVMLQYFEQANETIRGHLWFEGEVLKACQLDISVEIDTKKSSKVLEYKEKWDNFVREKNAFAGMSANHAFHTTGLWVKAEAHSAIIQSTVITILIECVIGFLCILVFTGDLILAVVVVSLVVINICGLAFFMVFAYGWTIGPIEVICLVVFVGYSVTFGLHVASNYAQAGPDDPILIEDHLLSKALRNRGCKAWRYFSTIKSNVRRSRSSLQESIGFAELEDDSISLPDLRLARTRIAIIHVGGAILSAVVSTIGSCIFLLFATLTIFNKLGQVVITVTLLSVVVTLLSLPAVLMLVGPGMNPCYKRIFKCGSSQQKHKAHSIAPADTDLDRDLGN